MHDWHVIVIEGPERDVRAFVARFLADRGADPASVVFGDDVDLEDESLVERLRALLRGGHHALLAPAELTPALVDAVAREGSEIGLRVGDHHAVAEASFGFEAEVFSREVSKAIRAALQALPEGVRFARHAEHEEEHAGAKGVELYAPAHHYAYRVSGELVGPVAGILVMHERLVPHEAVRTMPLRLTSPATA